MSSLKYGISELEKQVGTKTVCLTGATGYVAGRIVERLLAIGHTVHATCRDPTRESSIAHLKALPGGDERLKFFKADLLDMGSFDEAVKWCDFVVHTASPFVGSPPLGKEMEVVITPAVQGTENVLNAVNKTESVKRVVLTSSCAAIYGDPTERGKGHVFTEEDWCTTPSVNVLPYYYSKKAAEERAWQMVKQQSRWDLVAVNPAFVLGPAVGVRTDGESISTMQAVINGMPAYPNMGFGTTDNRVLAQAHCTALNLQVPSDRYIVECESLWFKDIIEAVKEIYPKQKYPRYAMPYFLFWLLGPSNGIRRDTVTHNNGKIPVFDHSKAWKVMQLPEYDIKQTIQDMARDLVAKGLVTLKE